MQPWLLTSVLLCVVLPLLPRTGWPMLASEIYWWLLAAAVLVAVRREGRPLSVLGLKRPTVATVGFGIAGALTLVVATYVVVVLVLPALGLRDDGSSVSQLGALSLPVQIALAVRAGVVEELLYRGYLIGRGTEVIPSRWLPAILSVAAFTVAHATSWSPTHLIFVAISGALLAGLFVWKRDLGANFIAHAGADLMLFLLASLAAQGGSGAA
ncbi:MAG: CPBP family intramembrane metalloprotease [Proteobacteria bacterium]|nr:CPBP family intramembrane metalloprotease [Pseudomonadota bacterium]